MQMSVFPRPALLTKLEKLEVWIKSNYSITLESRFFFYDSPALYAGTLTANISRSRAVVLAWKTVADGAQQLGVGAFSVNGVEGRR